MSGYRLIETIREPRTVKSNRIVIPKYSTISDKRVNILSIKISFSAVAS